MGRTDAKSNNRSGNITDGLRQKDLKLTVIFAPVSRSELLDIYNPIEFPTVDRQMRVISTPVGKSGNYVAETQDKVIYINCASIKCKCITHEDAPPELLGLDSFSMMDKLERAVQLVHELLDYWHGYKGTIQTTFCCYQPLEDLMVSLQSILGCSGGISAQDAEFFSDASVVFCDSFNQYKQWTFVNKHESVYKAEYKYEVYNDKSPTENLKEANEQIIDQLKEKDEEAWRKFREYYDASGMDKTTKMFSVEDYLKSHSEYEKDYKALRNNNEKLRKIEEDNQKFAEEWGKKSHGQRLGYVKKHLDEQYDPQINSVEGKYQPFLDEIVEKMKQLDYQQGKTSQFTRASVTKRAYDAYDIGVKLHGETHERETIEYNGEYRTMEELTGMYNMMKMRMKADKKGLESKKEKAWRQARDDIRKQINRETFEAGLAIMNIYAIVLAPLALVDILVISYKLAFTEQELDKSTLLSIGLDVFSLVPFVGAVFKAGGLASGIAKLAGKTEMADRFTKVGGEISHVSVADTIVNDVTAQGKAMVHSTVGNALENSANKALTNVERYSYHVRKATDKLERESTALNKLSTDAKYWDKVGDSAHDLSMSESSLGHEANADKLYAQAEEAWNKGRMKYEESLVHEAEAENARFIKEGAEANLKLAKEDLHVAKNQLHAFNQAVTGNNPSIGGGFKETVEEVGGSLIPLKGFVSDLSLYVKNFSNMSKGARATVAANLAVQAGGQVGTGFGIAGAYNAFASDPVYTVQSLGDFILIVRN